MKSLSGNNSWNGDALDKWKLHRCPASRATFPVTNQTEAIKAKQLVTFYKSKGVGRMALIRKKNQLFMKLIELGRYKIY